ncbi:hypothetical protein M0805_006473 [Coniferiporia weirii]|nr:hypothetical protein M0805_006473 [Coniferiporia weirii]
MQPAFARSLPVQILLDGIAFALTTVLLFHLLFTAQYHWPLAPVNYVLQLAGVLSLFVSLIATICVVLSQAFRDSQQWPYMLTYLSVPVPPGFQNTSGIQTGTNDTSLAMVYEPSVWSTSELAAWYVMDATTSALVQITHIQFLTLLYPSHLEARLILGLLAPLALLSAAMELLPIHQSQTIVDIADTVRNTCNAALSLLFTAALCLWGFAVNRKQAWRTDGGTAAFGAAAMALAVISTGLNFLYIPTKDQYTWLPHMIWVVVLWQSFLGWWWWVGGGRGVGEVEELLYREERRDRKRKARAARRSVRREKAQALWRNASESLGFARKGSATGEPIELANLTTPDGASASTVRTDMPSVESSTTTVPGGAGAPAAAGGDGLYARLRLSPPLLAVSHFYHLLRRAHLAAAHLQALERVRRKRAAYAGKRAADGDAGGDVDADVDPGVVGWGLGSFGLRERERREMEMEMSMADGGDREDLVRRPRGVGGDAPLPGRRTRERRTQPPPPPRQEPWSLWWWGPLRRWRLQDSTAYQ